ncbi:MAG TPA: hypothetical protein VJH55_03940 [Candidatus Paceibacterota bacterium]
MKKIIHNLRQRPEHHRKSIAVATSLSLTFIVFVMWISFFRLQYVPDNTSAPVAENGPVLMLKQQAASIYDSISNFSFKNIIFGASE